MTDSGHGGSASDTPLTLRLAGLAAWSRAGGDSDSMERSTITLGSLVIAALATIWVTAYLALDRPISAAIPLGYQLLSILSIWALRRRLLEVTTVRAI